MPETATWQDAVVEALKQADGKPLEMQAKVTIVPSNTDERNFYYVLELGKFVISDIKEYGEVVGEEVTFLSHDVTACATPCKGFRFRDTCRHVKQVKGEADG